MEKDFADWTFEEVRAEAVKYELDAIVRGDPLSKRIWTTLNLALSWKAAKDDKEKKKT